MAALLGSPAGAAADETLRQRLLTEAPRAWADYITTAEKIEGTFLEEESHQGVDHFNTAHRTTLVINGSLMKATQADLQDGREKTGVINDRSLFLVVRSKGAADYALGFFEAVSKTPTSEAGKMAESTTAMIKNVLYAPVYMLGQPLADWFHDPAFHLESVEPEGPDGLVRVDFEYRKRPNDPTEKEERIAPGSLVLDPANHWSLRSYRAGKWWGTMEGELDYGEPVDGLLLVRRRTERLRGNDKTSVERSFRTEKLTRRAAPREEFTLAAFGLPEPNPRAEAMTTRAWLIGLAVLFGLAALALRRRGGGRTGRATPAVDPPGGS